jgi:hypothetical protein
MFIRVLIGGNAQVMLGRKHHFSKVKAFVLYELGAQGANHKLFRNERIISAQEEG